MVAITRNKPDARRSQGDLYTKRKNFRVVQGRFIDYWTALPEDMSVAK